MKTSIYNQSGQVVGEQELDPRVFGVHPDPALLHFVVTAKQANHRRAIAHTKTRSEVRGGGRKPWKQKHTGRARHGSIRSPIWSGGGVTFGPRADRNYTQKINKKVLRNAVRMSLSAKADEKKFLLIDSWNLPQSKTKTVKTILSALEIPLMRKHAVLLVAHEKVASLVRGARNISSVRTIGKENVNVLDLLTYPYLVTTPETVAYWMKVYGV